MALMRLQEDDVREVALLRVAQPSLELPVIPLGMATFGRRLPYSGLALHARPLFLRHLLSTGSP